MKRVIIYYHLKGTFFNAVYDDSAFLLSSLGASTVHLFFALLYSSYRSTPFFHSFSFLSYLISFFFFVYFPRSVAIPSGVLLLVSNIRGWATNAFSIFPYRPVYFLYQSTVIFNPSSHDISSFQPSSCSLDELIVYRKSLNLRSGTNVIYSSSLSSSPKILSNVFATFRFDNSLSPPILYT